MPSALGRGLMGAAYGALAGAHDVWQNEQRVAQTQRLLAANALEQEKLAAIKAEYADAKDTKDHEQAKELEGVKAGNREKLEGEKIAAADKRAAENNASRERSAATRANRPAGSGTPPKPQWFSHPSKPGKWVTPGQDPGEGFEPGKVPRKTEVPKPGGKLTGGLTDPSRIPKGAVIAGRSPNGQTVYRTPDGELWTAD